MKLLNKILTVGLSLVMCAGMTAPAFAVDAVDAYYYVEVEKPNNCPEIKVDYPNPKDEDNQTLSDDELTGDGMNGEWAFMGKGTVDGETLNELKLGVEKNDTVKFDESGLPIGENGLPEGFELPPEETKQTFNGGVYHNPGQEPGAKLESVTVDTFHDIGQYEYDDETKDEAAGQFTYTIVWDNVEAQTGFNLNGSECTGMEYDETNKWSAYYNQNIEFDTGEVNYVHVNGTATLHENAALTVVVKDNGKEEQNKTDDPDTTTYVRDKQKSDRDAVDKIASKLSGITEEDKKYYDLTVEQGEDGKSVTATYTEQTYNVTYQITGNQGSGVNVSGNDSINGKATQKWDPATMMKDTIGAVGGVGGMYSFSGWNVVIDEVTGDVTVTAVCTFTPYYVDPGDTGDTGDTDDGDTGTTIDDAIVPLAEGPVTRAEFINYLWQHEGQPASAGVCTFTDVESIHAYFDALCWAEESGVAEAYVDAEGHEDGTFEPDELITVGAARALLDNFANVFGTNAVAAADLASLIGEDDEPVFNCGEVLAEFFGEEYAAAEGSGAETAA